MIDEARKKYSYLSKLSSAYLDNFFFESSSFLHCLHPLLDLLGWIGDKGTVSEALPHFHQKLTLNSFLRVIKNLGFDCESISLFPQALDSRLLPCLFLDEGGEPLIALEKTRKGLLVYNSEKKEFYEFNNLLKKRNFFFFKANDKKNNSQNPERTWFSEIIYRHKGAFAQILAMSFLSGILGLSIPIFVMGVYDRVIGAESPLMLVNFLVGLGIALLGILALALIKNKMLGTISCSLDNIVGGGIFEKIINLPLSYMESTNVGMQLARMNSLDSVRLFFTGPLAEVIINIPANLVFLTAIAVLGGNLVFIPLFTFCFLCGMTLIYRGVASRVADKYVGAKTKKQAFLIEALEKHDMIKYSANEYIWIEKYREILAKTLLGKFKEAVLSQALSAITNFFVMLSVLGLAGFGVFKVVSGQLSPGALFAIMMIVWRIMTPIKILTTSLCHLCQLKKNVQQVNKLMTLPSENKYSGNRIQRVLDGRVSFKAISHRYGNELAPSLASINLDIQSKEFVVIYGKNGSGKSTLIKLLLGLSGVQTGTILIGGKDIRQISVKALRKEIAYMPQIPQFFYGTISQNLRLANPLASEQEIHKVAIQAKIYDEIMSMPEGFSTRLTDQFNKQISPSFFQRLSLARALIKNSPILLIDELSNNLDCEIEEQLMQILQQLRGKLTLIKLTHRMKHLWLADRAICLESGRILFDGTPDQVQLQEMKKRELV